MKTYVHFKDIAFFNHCQKAKSLENAQVLQASDDESFNPGIYFFDYAPSLNVLKAAEKKFKGQFFFGLIGFAESSFQVLESYLGALATENYDSQAIDCFVRQSKKQALLQKKLREKEVLIDLVGNANEMGICSCNDFDGNDNAFSPLLYKVLGYKRDEAENKKLDLSQLIHENDLEKFEKLKNFNFKENTFSTTLRVKTKERGYRWMVLNAAAYNHNKKYSQKVITLRDVHERISTEEKLAQNQSRLKMAVKSLKAGIVEFYQEKEYEWWSPKLYELLGKDPAKFKPKKGSITKLVHPDDLPAFRKELDRFYEAQDHFECEVRLKSAGDDYKWFQFFGTGIFNSEEQVLKITGSLVDISEKVEYEQKLKQSEKEFKLLTEHAPSPVFISRKEELLYLNPAGLKVLKAKNIEDIDLSSLVQKDELIRIQERLDDLKHKKQTTNRLIVNLQDLEGNAIKADISLGFTTYKGENAIIGTGVDITDQTLAKQALELNERLLNNAQQTAKIGSWYKSPDGSIWWSQYLKKLLQIKSYSRELEDLIKRVHPDDQLRVKNYFDAVLSFKSAEKDFIFRLKTPKGFRYMEANSVVNKSLKEVYGTLQDIHLSKQIELQKEQQRNFYQRILNSVPVEIAVLDSDCKYIYVSERAIADSQKKKDIIGKTDVEYFEKWHKNEPEYNRISELRKQKILQSKKDKKEVSWIEKVEKQGETRFLRRAYFPVVENNEVVEYVAYATDLTDKIHFENQLKFRVQFEELILEISNELINTPSSRIDNVLDKAINEIGMFVDVDRSYLFQLHHQQAYMDNRFEWCNNDIIPYKQQLQNLSTSDYSWLYNKLNTSNCLSIENVSELGPEASFEKAEFEKEGIQSILIVPLRVGNKLKGFIGLDSVKKQRKWDKNIRDLLKIMAQVLVNGLERKEYQSELEASEQKFRTLTENAHAAIFITKNLRFVYANPETTEIFGYEYDELLTKTIIDLFDEKERDSALKTAQNIFDHDLDGSRNERKIIAKNGEVKYIDITSNSISYNGEDALISIALDVTDKKITEVERLDLIEQLTKQNKDLEQFSYITSHNLRSPVAGIKGLIGMVDHAKLGADINYEVMGRIGKAAEKLDNVIRDLNDVVALKQKTGEQRQWVDLNSVLDEIIDSHSVLIENNQAFINRELNAAKIFSVKGYIYSILTNLITNAVKYRKPEKKPIITVKSQIENDQVVLSITDNGLGIDLVKYEDKLFKFKQRFHLEIEGHGMGLYLVKTQVESIGGQIEVESAVNEGTTFRVTIPVQS